MPVLWVELVAPQHQPRVTVRGREEGREGEKRRGEGKGCIEEKERWGRFVERRKEAWGGRENV